MSKLARTHPRRHRRVEGGENGNLPGAPNESWLRVQCIIPTPNANVQPPLSLARKLDPPRPPCMVELLTEPLPGNLPPHTPTIQTHLHSDGPSPTSAIRPPLQSNLSLVHDDFLVLGHHDRRTNRHILDTKPIRVRRVLLPRLRTIIQILLLLHRRHTRPLNHPHLV